MKTRPRRLQVRLNNSIECAKERFYNKIANKLNDSRKNAKAYWSLIKMLLNNKKIPLIPPLYYDNRFITDSKEKAELFNSFFSKQCSLISNNSSLTNYINYTTEKQLSTVALSVESSGKIIQNLDSNKAHGHDNRSIVCLRYVVTESMNQLRQFLDKLFLLEFFLLNGKKVTLFLSTKK